MSTVEIWLAQCACHSMPYNELPQSYNKTLLKKWWPSYTATVWVGFIQILSILKLSQVLEDFSSFLFKLEDLQEECRKDVSSKKLSKLVRPSAQYFIPYFYSIWLQPNQPMRKSIRFYHFLIAGSFFSPKYKETWDILFCAWGKFAIFCVKSTKF